MTQPIKTRSEQYSDMNIGDSLGSPCTPDGAVDLLIDSDEIKYNVDVHQFGYIR